MLAITVCQCNKEKVKHFDFNLPAAYQFAVFVLICIRPPFVAPSAVVPEHMTRGGQGTPGGEEGGVCVTGRRLRQLGG